MAHLAFFWGFLVFAMWTIEAIIRGARLSFSWKSALGGAYPAYASALDVANAALVVGVIVALVRRFVVKTPRLRAGGVGRADAATALFLILLIALVAALDRGLAADKGDGWTPVASFVAEAVFGGFSAEEAARWGVWLWAAHLALVFGFLNYLPFSKHLHVLLAAPNAILAKPRRARGALESLDVEDEERERFGADDVDALPWNLLLNAYACTECGRCDDACPATQTGKALSPRAIEIAVRRRSEEFGEEGALTPDLISEKEIWQCLTCGACAEECPVMIETADTIVETRRHYALTAGETPPEIDRVLRDIERTGNPYGMPASERLSWADGLSVKKASEDADAEWLLWVGCAGAYDERAKRSTRAFAQILDAAGVEYRVLGEEERCAGDLPRRLGEEYLAKTLIEENIETFARYGVTKIVTACPHCFHSLKREYPQFGGNFEVWHSTEFLDKLFAEGRLSKATTPSGADVAYHDSCYLGRHNGAYEPARRVIKNATGREPKEPKHTRSRGFCCGGGGGGAFREETEGEPTIRRRVEELTQTGAERVAVACPFCLRMIEDELTRRNESRTIRVLDVAEATLDAIEQTKHE